MPAAPIRFALGAVAGASLSFLLVVQAGMDGMFGTLASALPFGLALAWLGHRNAGLPLGWAVSTLLLMPGFYYVAIWMGIWFASALPGSRIFMVGLGGGAVGAFLIWIWTGLFDKARLHWPGFAAIIGAGAATGALLLLAKKDVDDAWSLVILHAGWQGVMLMLLPAARAEPRPGS